MKIAVLGKGGTGKSSVSWLLTKHLAVNSNNNVLAIDADHNMDLTSCLEYEAQEEDNQKYLYRANDSFKEFLGIPKNQRWQVQFDENFENKAQIDKIKFGYKPADSYLDKFIFPVTQNLDLIIVGLGEKDIMYTGMCSHGLSSPLKYLIPRLGLTDNSYMVMDSVAGTDMINYGLYFGFDVVIVVVEGHINSIKVAKQLDEVLVQQGMKAHFVLNKYNPENQLIQDFLANPNISNRVLGQIPVDSSIMSYDYQKVKLKTKSDLDIVIKKISELPKISTEGLALLKKFEDTKTELAKIK